MKRSIIITLALIAAIAVPLCASSGWARGLLALAIGSGVVVEENPAFLLDTFTASTDTALSSHPPETGGTWVADTATGASSYGTVYANIDAVKLSTGSGAVWYNTATPPSADYTVTAQTVFPTVGSYVHSTGVCVRMDGAGKGLCARYEPGSNGKLKLFALDAGTYGWVGRYPTEVIPSVATVVGETYTLSLSMAGTEYTATLKDSSLQTIATKSGTTSWVTAAGYAGFIIGDTTTSYITTIEAE